MQYELLIPFGQAQSQLQRFELFFVFFFFQIGFGKLCQASSLEPKHYFSSLILCQGILTSGAVSVVEQRTDFHGNDKETT